MSSVYWPAPVRKRASSTRRTDSPMCGSFAKSDAPMIVLLSGRGLHGGRTLLHRLHDVLVARAAADVAVELIADLRFARARVTLAQVHRALHHARHAEPALQSVALLERGLHRKQQADSCRQAFDGRDLRARML